MTFWGVNYLLSGLHSYGENEGVAETFGYLYAALAGIIALATISFRGYRKMNSKVEENKTI